MSTPATIKAALQSLISQANATTGASDTTVTAAVETLIDGYGGTGGGEWTTDGMAAGNEPSGVLTIHNATIANYSFYYRSRITGLIFDGLTSVGTCSFSNCTGISELTLPLTLRTLGNQAFGGCSGLRTVKFLGTPSSINANAFYRCTGITDIYVPWASGAVSSAPWGATNATIHYGTQYDANGNII